MKRNIRSTGHSSSRTHFSISVYRRQWQAVVHAGDVFVRGLLYDTTVLRVDISRSDVDRTEVPPSPTTDDGPWHPPVPQHSKDIELHSSRPTRIHLHLRLVDRSWHHSFGETTSYFFCVAQATLHAHIAIIISVHQFQKSRQVLSKSA